MALSTAIVTLNLRDLLGETFNARRTRITLRTNVPDDTIADTATGEVRLGGGKVTLDETTGIATATVWTPGPDGNPTSWQTYFDVEYDDKSRHGVKQRRTFGPFTITASADLADLIEEQAVPPTYLTQVTQQLDTYVDSAQASATSSAASATSAAASASVARSVAEIDTPDALVAAIVEDDASATKVALAADFASKTTQATVESGRLSEAGLSNSIDSGADERVAVTGPNLFAPVKANRVLVLGNSIERASDNSGGGSGGVRGTSWFTYATICSQQRIQYWRNAGVGGDRTANMIARFDTDVTPYAPGTVILGTVENDSAPENNVTFAEFKSRVAELCRRIRAIGAQVVLRTGLPNNATGTRHANLIAFNAWLRDNADALGAVAVLDFYKVLIDPSTGGFLAGTNSDSTHPNDYGNSLLGAYAAQVLAPLLPPWAPPLSQDASDPWNVAPNKGLFVGATINANKEPSGWQTLNPTSIASAELVTGDPNIVGNWFKMNFSASAAETSLYKGNLTGASSTFAPGHEYLYAARVKTDLSAGTINFEVGLSGTTAGRSAYLLGGDIADGIVMLRGIVPAGTGAGPPSLQHKVTAGTTGTVQVAQITLVDLTDMGVV